MNTPELSNRLIERHCTVRVKSLNSSLVYHNNPMPPSDSIVSLPITLKRPEPAICHPASVGFIRETAPTAGAGFAFSAIAAAVRRAKVSAVSEGFAEPSAGKSAGPAM